MKKYITDKEKFNKLKEKVKKEKFDDIFVLADFDRTFTYGTINGEKAPTLTSELKANKYLDEEFSQKAKKLSDKYQPIADDPSATLKEKKKTMTKWRKKKARLMIKNGFTKSDLKEAMAKSEISLREGVPEFLDFLYENKIPLVVISGSGTGSAIPIFFENIGRDYDNIHYIVNDFEWDEEGRAVSATEPFIHFLNKDEIKLSDFQKIYKEIKERKDVILLGDSIEDIVMIEGFEYNLLLTIGLLCYEITDKRRKKYKKNFDVVLEGGGGFRFINQELFNLK